MMDAHDIDRDLFRQLRLRSIAPAVDVVVRVSETIRDLPPRPLLHRWTMAVCAALCATAAGIALIASLASANSASGSHAPDLVIETYEIDVQSLLR
jgi:hypothetical protein